MADERRRVCFVTPGRVGALVALGLAGLAVEAPKALAVQALAVTIQAARAR